jgi:hypothetical protein
MSWYDRDFARKFIKRDVLQHLEHQGVSPSSHPMVGDFLSGDGAGAQIVIEALGYTPNQIIRFDRELPTRDLAAGVEFHLVDLNTLARQIKKGDEIPEPIANLRGSLDVLLFLGNAFYIDPPELDTLKNFFGKKDSVLIDL